MTVIDRTEGGYTKVEHADGTVTHRDPNGHPVKQQSFAASKQAETYEHEITKRSETGQFEETKTRRKEPEPEPEPEPKPEPPQPYYRTVVSGSMESGESDSAAEIIAWRVTRAPENVAEVVAHWEKVRREVAQELPMVLNIEPENKEENEPIMPVQVDNRGKVGQMQEVVIVFNGYSSYEYTGGLGDANYGYPQQDL